MSFSALSCPVDYIGFPVAQDSKGPSHKLQELQVVVTVAFVTQVLGTWQTLTGYSLSVN